MHIMVYTYTQHYDGVPPDRELHRAVRSDTRTRNEKAPARNFLPQYLITEAPSKASSAVRRSTSSLLLELHPISAVPTGPLNAIFWNMSVWCVCRATLPHHRDTSATLFAVQQHGSSNQLPGRVRAALIEAATRRHAAANPAGLWR